MESSHTANEFLEAVRTARDGALADAVLFELTQAARPALVRATMMLLKAYSTSTRSLRALRQLLREPSRLLGFEGCMFPAAGRIVDEEFHRMLGDLSAVVETWSETIQARAGVFMDACCLVVSLPPR